MKKHSSFKTFVIIMLVSLFITAFWNDLKIIKEGVHFILDPTLGFLLHWNLNYGMLLIILLLSVITVLIQKYFTDQDSLKELKKEQKRIQEEIKKYKNEPKRAMELQKKQLEALPKTLKLNLKPMVLTSIPLLLFFRWFMDFFATLGNAKFFGFMSWFVFYLIFTLIFTRDRKSVV